MPRLLQLKALSTHIGAEIGGVDLSKPIDDALFDEIQNALFDHAVIVFRDQRFSPSEQIAFARRFGELDVHPIANGMPDHPEMIRVWKPAGERAFFGTSWHTDNTFFEQPSDAVVLFGDTIPEVGGDTLYASMRAAYETLSPAMQEFLGGLTAIHSAASAYDPKTTGDAKYKGEAAINYTFYSETHLRRSRAPGRPHAPGDRADRGLFVNPMFSSAHRRSWHRAREPRRCSRCSTAHAVRRPDFCVSAALVSRERWRSGTTAARSTTPSTTTPITSA